MTVTPAAKVVLYIVLAAFIVLYGVDYSQRAEEDTARQSAQPQPQDSNPQYMTRQEVLDRVAVETVTPGEGPQSKEGETVLVHYRGSFEDGTVFDDSFARGEPFQFVLASGNVIPGWDVGVQGMKKGETRKLVIPPEVAYGANGSGPIPPNTTLYFEVELLEIVAPAPAKTADGE